MIGFILFIALVSFLDIFVSMAKSVKLLALKYYKRCKSKKKENKIVDLVEEPEQRTIDLTNNNVPTNITPPKPQEILTE